MCELGRNLRLDDQGALPSTGGGKPVPEGHSHFQVTHGPAPGWGPLWELPTQEATLWELKTSYLRMQLKFNEVVKKKEKKQMR